MDWNMIQERIDQGDTKLLEKMGLINQRADGSWERNINAEKNTAERMTSIENRKQRIHLKEGDEEDNIIIKGKNGRTTKVNRWVEELS